MEIRLALRLSVFSHENPYRGWGKLRPKVVLNMYLKTKEHYLKKKKKNSLMLTRHSMIQSNDRDPCVNWVSHVLLFYFSARVIPKVRDEGNGLKLRYTHRFIWNIKREKETLNRSGRLISMSTHIGKSSSSKTSPVNFPFVRWVNNLIGSLRWRREGRDASRIVISMSGLRRLTWSTHRNSRYGADMGTSVTITVYTYNGFVIPIEGI